MKQRRDDVYPMFVYRQAAPEGEPRHYRHSPGLRVPGGEGGRRPHARGQLRARHHLQGGEHCHCVGGSCLDLHRKKLNDHPVCQ